MTKKRKDGKPSAEEKRQASRLLTLQEFARRNCPRDQVAMATQIGGLLLVKLRDDSCFAVPGGGWEHRIPIGNWEARGRSIEIVYLDPPSEGGDS